ncbi:toprim domain-containing protein [Streptomyces sp. 796.1]
MKLRESQKADLVAAGKRYSSQYPESPAAQYMEHRGLGEQAEQFRVGYVSDPITGHEWYRGRLAIPYLRPAGGVHALATMRFRCIADECVKDGSGAYVQPHEEAHEKHAKYLTIPGHNPHLFNTAALLTSSTVVLCEGELDAMAVSGLGVPAVGVPGVASWRDHFDPAFAGLATTLVVGDGDEAGRAFTRKVCERLASARPIDLGDGYDANRFIVTYGKEASRERLGLAA